MPLLLCSVLSLSLLSGCYSSKSYLMERNSAHESYGKINRKAKNKNVFVGFVNGDSLMVTNLAIVGDSVLWVNPESGSKGSAAISGLREIKIEKRNAGKGRVRAF